MASKQPKRDCKSPILSPMEGIQVKVTVNGVQHEVEILGRTARINGQPARLQIIEDDEILLGEKRYTLDFAHEEGDDLLMIVNGMAFVVSRPAELITGRDAKEVKAPMSGQLVDVSVRSGSEVKKGQLLLVLEAMKMENQINSPISGKVKAVLSAKGQQVKLGDTLIVFE